MIQTVNIAYYEKKDWEFLLLVIDDRESMSGSWEDWFMNYSKIKSQLKSQGFFVKEVPINIHELIAYCTDKGIKNDGKARSQFVQMK